MKLEITIPGELPSLNEIIDAAKNHWGQYNTMKETYTELVRLSCLRCPKLDKPVKVKITWYTKDLMKDPDNVIAGQKFIFDGLVAAKVIPDDTRRWVKGIEHEFGLDRRDPRVEIEIVEVEE
jgi:hypothetical protein